MIKRIFKSIMGVSLAVLFTCILLIMTVLYQYFESRFFDELVNQAAFIEQGIDNQGLDYFTGLKKSDTRITVVTPDGKVIYDSHSDPKIMENHADRKEIKEAMEKSIGKSNRYSETMSKKVLNYAVKMSDGNILRVSGVKYSVMALIFNIAQPLAVIIIALLFISGSIAFNISKRLVSPINEINLEHPEKADTYEELSPFLGRIASQNKQISLQLKEFKRRQEQFTAITENMTEGFLVIDSRTNILSFNKSVLNILGIKNISENSSILTVNRSIPFRKSVDLALAGKHSEQNIKLNDRLYHIFANPVVNDEVIAGAVIVILDVTEKEDRENLRREFSANVSHELKTPLTAISGIAEIMKSGIVKPEDTAHFAEMIFEESQRLITLIGDIIKLSQLDESDRNPEFTKINLLATSNKIAAQLEPSAEKLGISLKVSGDSCEVNGNTRIIEEMIYNLCDNAIKYNKDRGKVDINVENQTNRVILSVSDTGIGIPYSEKDRIFERFYRIDKSHSKEVGGTGLGLSIVKHGAIIHNAEIELTSDVGKGTEIRIIFNL